MNHLYDLLSTMYHQDLFDYLDGYDCSTLGFTAHEHFTFYGCCMLGTALAIAAIFYLAINSPRFNHRSHWVLFMIVAFIVNFGIGFYFTNDDLGNGSINQMMYSCPDGDGNMPSQQVDTLDCALFGLSNAIFAAVFYFIASIGLKYASRNCKVVPF